MDKVIKGLVTKPQFDLDVFAKGTAIKLTNTGNCDGLGYQFKESCLVIRATPLKLKVVFYDTEDDTDTAEIDIKDVASGKLKIEFLEVVNNG